jgi:tetratricopeptide (TPR) repeat protein
MKNRIRFKSGSLIIIASLLLCATASSNSVQGKRNDKATVEPTELHLKDGYRLMKLGDYEGASDEFLQACYFARNKYCPEGWLQLGICYKEMKNYAKAIEALTNHLSQTTEPAADAHCDLAECYVETSQFDKAEDEIRKARIDAYQGPGTSRPFYALGELQEKMGKYPSAWDAYNMALGAKPWKYTDAWMARARCEIKMKPPRYNEALKDYREIIDAGPKGINWVELYYNMAMCLYKRGDHQGAIDHLLEALKANPDHFDSHLALAHIFDEEKHVTSAVNQYEHAIRTAAKDYNTETINKRLIFLQGQLGEQEKEKVVKPSPYMRQEMEQQQQAQQGQSSAQHPKGDSGF